MKTFGAEGSSSSDCTCSLLCVARAEFLFYVGMELHCNGIESVVRFDHIMLFGYLSYSFSSAPLAKVKEVGYNLRNRSRLLQKMFSYNLRDCVRIRYINILQLSRVE